MSAIDPFHVLSYLIMRYMCTKVTYGSNGTDVYRRSLDITV